MHFMRIRRRELAGLPRQARLEPTQTAVRTAFSECAAHRFESDRRLQKARNYQDSREIPPVGGDLLDLACSTVCYSPEPGQLPRLALHLVARRPGRSR